MNKRKHCDHEFKAQGVRLALGIGHAMACNELKLPKNTFFGWMYARAPNA